MTRMIPKTLGEAIGVKTFPNAPLAHAYWKLNIAKIEAQQSYDRLVFWDREHGGQALAMNKIAGIIDSLTAILTFIDPLVLEESKRNIQEGKQVYGPEGEAAKDSN